MARCSGCAGDRCSCVIREGANVTITGAGTLANPLVISSEAGGAGAVPAGAIVMYGAAAPPAGWLLCNGAAVNRVTYAALFAAIGTTYGAGDNSTTFNTPNLEQKFPLGAGGTYDRGETGGSFTHTLTLNHIPQHSHSMNHGHTASSGSAGGHAHPYQIGFSDFPTHNWTMTDGGGGNRRDFSVDTTQTTQSGGEHSHTVTVNTFTGSTGTAGQANPTPVDNTPPFLVVNFLVKT